ncbi:MAG: hypothetical protein HUJ61_03020 [Bacilli bacterium]|nr:hypothetical protein [Bacilli bacterium]
MAASGKDYFGLSRLISVILAIIPITALVLGVLTRLKEGHIFCALFRLLVGWNIIWILDLVCMVLKGKIFRIN